MYNCVLWKAQKDGGIPKPEKHYGCTATEIKKYFEKAQTDDVTVMFESWEARKGYDPNTNFVWEPENPYWEPKF